MIEPVSGPSVPPRASNLTPLSSHAIFVRYVLFAFIAGLANLGSQALVVYAWAAGPIMISVLFGTGIGFVTKYILDKYWVFLDSYGGHAAEIRKIAFYGFFSIGTTLIFWGVELGFWHVWQTQMAKYGGGALGLIFGNWIKYYLDKHYVFTAQS